MPEPAGPLFILIFPALLEIAGQHRDRPAGEEVEEEDDAVDRKRGGRVGEAVRVDDLLSGLQDLHDTDQDDQGGGLDHTGDQVDRQRNQATKRLRDDDVEAGLQRGHPERRCALVLVLRDTDEGPSYEVSHLRGAPEDKDDDGTELTGEIDSEGPGRTEIHDEQQHELRHDTDEIEVHAAQCLRDRILPRHEHTEEDAQRDGNQYGDEGDADGHPQSAQQPDEIVSLKQDRDSRCLLLVRGCLCCRDGLRCGGGQQLHAEPAEAIREVQKLEAERIGKVINGRIQHSAASFQVRFRGWKSEAG